MKICLYGSSSTDIDSLYIDAVEKLGHLMANRGHSLVFGGGAQGLMGAAVRGITAENGRSLGIAPKFFDKPGILFKECTDFIFTDTMRERKELMEKNADAFLVVPGGIGTFEEFFEILTLKQLNQLNKPIALYNITGYYDSLANLLENTIRLGFMKEECHKIYGIYSDADSLLAALEEEAFRPLDLRNLKNI